MSQNNDALRLAEVYRLSLGGLSQLEIANQIAIDLPGTMPEQVEADLELIARWQDEYQDPEKVRMSLTLDLDSMFKSIIAEIRGNWVSKQANAKALFYREAREVLLQKALLYGLNTQNVNVNQKSKLWTVIQQLRQDATQLEAETNYPQLAEPDDLPVAIEAPSGLLVENYPDNGR